MPLKPSRLSCAERNALRARLSQVLTRIDEPDFGYCVGCGTGIALPRLMAEPFAIRCTRCQEESAAAVFNRDERPAKVS